MKTIIMSLLLASAPLAYANESAEPALSARDAAELNELEQTLEARAYEEDRKSDGAETILDRTIASENSEFAAD